MELFAVQCTTCNARLKVRDAAAIGHILACPKCGGMVHIAAPAGWTPPDPAASASIPAAGAATSATDAATPAPVGSESVSGYTIKIPQSQLAALHAAKAAKAAGAAKPAAPSIPATTSSAAVPAAATKSNDIAPPPASAPAASFASRAVAGVARNWILCVSAPVVAMVIALLAWIIWHPAPTAFEAPVARTAVVPPAEVAADPSASPRIAEPDANLAAARVEPPPAAPADDVAANSPPAGDEAPPVEPNVADAAPPDNEPAAAVLAADNPPAGDKAPTPPAVADPMPAPPAAGADPAPVAVAGRDVTDPAQAARVAADKAAAADAPITREMLPQIEVDARLADPLPGLEFKRVSLADFCDFLSRLSTVPITIDVDALGLAGVHATDLLAVQTRDTTIGEALDDALAKRGLIHVVVGQQVIVTTLDRNSEGQATVKYDVGDLVADPDQAAALAAVVTRFVAPLSWQDRGGKSTIQAAESTLSISQTPIEHRHVAMLLDRLRQARGLAAKESLRPDESSLKSRYSRARANLDKPITANFAIETPLADILAWLSRAAGTRLLIDEVSLAEAEQWSGWPATLVADRQPLHEALTALLSPQGMTFRIVDERTVQVFARNALPGRFECELYPVGDLLAGGIGAEKLVNRMRELVDPPSWSGASGPAAIELDAAGKCLLVMQSPEAHIRLETRLDKAKSGVRAAR